MFCVENGGAQSNISSNEQVCCNGYIAGMIKERKGHLSFISYKVKRKQALKQKKARQAKRYQLLSKSGAALCRQAKNPDPEAPAPTPVAGPEATPPSIPVPVTPTPAIPPAASQNFTDAGDVTTDGKECFKIPADINANVFRGEIEIRDRCVSCHGMNLFAVPETLLYDRSFVYVRDKTRISPMNQDEISLPNQALADIVAYLNASRSTGCNQ